MANNSQHRCVFVGNIPYDASEEQLIQICEEVGPVVSFRLVIDRETGKPKGYGFCEYKDEETALSARRNLQGYEINGRQLRVDFAENDKGADRNREQGRGGPGLTSNVDSQRSSGGPATLGDSALYQSVGLPLSSTAASVMAGALGGVQIDSMSSKQSGLPSQSGFANDPLTLHLANVTKKQLYDIMSEMKVMGTQNKELARQLLSLCPSLLKALFQAQIMLGMVPPQMLQMSNIRQQSPSSLPLPTLQDGMQDPKLAMRPPYPGQPPFTHNKTQLGMLPRLQDAQGPTISQNTPVNNQPPLVPFQQVSVQPRFHSQQTQNQPILPTTGPVQPGVSTVPSLRPLSGLSLRPQPPSLESSSAMQQPVQPIPLSGGTTHSSQLGFQNSTPQSVLPRPLSSQTNFQPGSSNAIIGSGLLDISNKHGAAQVTNETRFHGSNSNLIPGTQEQTSIAGKSFDSMHHPSKLARLEDGRSAIHNIVGQNTTMTTGSGPAPVYLPRNQVPRTDMIQNSEKQVLQLAPDVQSALLEQVKSLTPEQLSSLPPEQRQQVIDLQKMLQ